MFKKEIARSEHAKRLLEALVVNSGEDRKICVWVKFKGSNVAHEELLTYKQYKFLKTLDCVEVYRASFCA